MTGLRQPAQDGSQPHAGVLARHESGAAASHHRACPLEDRAHINASQRRRHQSKRGERRVTSANFRVAVEHATEFPLFSKLVER